MDGRDAAQILRGLAEDTENQQCCCHVLSPMLPVLARNLAAILSGAEAIELLEWANKNKISIECSSAGRWKAFASGTLMGVGDTLLAALRAAKEQAG